MPLEFIPNQPFIWETPIGTQDCLNNDTRIGSQIVTQGDTICVQQKLLPCDETVNAEPTMSSGAGTGALGGWTVSGGWSTGGSSDLSYSGAGGVVGSATQTNGALLPGCAYRIEFEITAIAGDASVAVALGIDSTDVYTAIGTYVVYLICQNAGDSLEFIMASGATTAGDTCTITGINYYNVTTDWKDELNFGFPSWTYSLQTDNFLTYANGKFCALDQTGGDLICDNAYVTDNSYHSVEFTISDCTQGGVEVILGGDYLGTTSGNGTFKYYGVPTDSSLQLRFVKVDLFDGCINAVTVDDYGVLDNTDSSVVKMEVANSSGVAATDPIPYVLSDDRITWCVNVDDLENGGNPIELSCDIMYRLLITVQCAEEAATEYTSLTHLRYDQGGWDCTKVVEAYADGYQLGFYFGATTAPVFRLIQRLRVLQFAPSYPIEGEEYLYSSGVWGRSFGQRGKVRTCHFDYVDEATHDTISAQMLCDVLLIDDVQFYAPTKEYKPEWDDNKYNLAQSRIDLVAVDEKYIFKRNC